MLCAEYWLAKEGRKKKIRTFASLTINHVTLLALGHHKNSFENLIHLKQLRWIASHRYSIWWTICNKIYKLNFVASIKFCLSVHPAVCFTWLNYHFLMVLSWKGQENSKWQRPDAVESNPGCKTKRNDTVDKSIDKMHFGLQSEAKKKKRMSVHCCRTTRDNCSV